MKLLSGRRNRRGNIGWPQRGQRSDWKFPLEERNDHIVSSLSEQVGCFLLRILNLLGGGWGSSLASHSFPLFSVLCYLSAPSAHQHVCPLPSARPRFCVCPGFTWQSRKHTGPLSSPTDTPAPSAPLLRRWKARLHLDSHRGAPHTPQRSSTSGRLAVLVSSLDQALPAALDASSPLHPTQ